MAIVDIELDFKCPIFAGYRPFEWTSSFGRFGGRPRMNPFRGRYGERFGSWVAGVSDPSDSQNSSGLIPLGRRCGQTYVFRSCAKQACTRHISDTKLANTHQRTHKQTITQGSSGTNNQPHNHTDNQSHRQSMLQANKHTSTQHTHNHTHMQSCWQPEHTHMQTGRMTKRRSVHDSL